MNSITIITIVVIALLTIIIFGLTWISYMSCIKMYRMEVKQGMHDTEIFNQYNTKNKKNNWVSFVIICIISTILLSLFVIGIIYKIKGESLEFNNQTALVVKSGSMSEFYNDKLAEEYQEYNYDSSLQFDIGDICIFEKVSEDEELVEGEVYGYKYKNIIITHRLIKIHDGKAYEFRGDNNSTSDGVIDRDCIIYHYTGNKISTVGVFILYAQSYFGLWSLFGIIGVIIISDTTYRKITKIQKERNEIIKDREETL